MFLSRLDSKERWFQSLEANSRADSSVMNLDPGQFSAEEPESERCEDQVFLVLEGEVLAEFGEERARMPAGHVLVIPAGVPHRFCNLGHARARTMRVYATGDHRRVCW